jgi:hypothetical protein
LTATFQVSLALDISLFGATLSLLPLLTIVQFFLGIGAFVAGWIGYGCSQGSPGTALEWRLPVSIPVSDREDHSV